MFWKTQTRSYLQSLGADVWAIFEGGYQYPASVPTDAVERRNMKPMQRQSMHYWEV